MLIKDFMSRNVVTVKPDTSISDAANLLKEKRIRRLCAVKRDRLVGIVTDSDVKEASPSDATTLSIHEMVYLLAHIQVKDIMTKDPITIESGKSIDDAAVQMLKNRISSLPVMENKRLVGIVTESDIFKAIVMLTGAYQGGIKFGFELDDQPGSIKIPADAIRAHGGRIVSILTNYEDAREGFRKVYIRAKDIAPRDVKHLKGALQRQFRVLYILEQGNG